MDIIKIVLIGIITCIADILIKKIKPELSILIILTGCCLILLSIVGSLKTAFSGVNGIFSLLNFDSNIVKCVFKILGVGYLVEFGASICNDSGHSSIAEKIVLAGKIAILIMCLPIISNLIKILIEIMP